MDNTSRDAAAAKKAEMGYGQGKILHPETAPKKADKKYKYHRTCPECSAEFGTDKWDKLYCCSECASRYNSRRYQARRRATTSAMSKL